MFKNFEDLNENIKDVFLEYHPRIYKPGKISNIKLVYKNKIIILSAETECSVCSVSWLKSEEKFTSLIGKNIKNITHLDFTEDDRLYDPDDLESSIVYKKHTYRINFKDSNETFNFCLINKSKGWYDGYLKITET